MTRHRLGRWLKWTALGTLIGLLVLEGALRGLGWHFTRRFDAAQKKAYAQRDCLNILALGESTTGGLWVDPSQSYPSQLERLLTQRYGRPVCVVTPMHFGQNTSQMYNRFDRYMTTISPRLVIFMCGVNNTWSLEESNIGWFINLTDPRSWGIFLRLTLDHYRVFKLARMAKYDLEAWRTDAKEDLSGAPRFSPWPPSDANIQFGSRNYEGFLELWKYEVLVLGDSLLYGWANPVDGRLTEQLQAWYRLAGADVEVFNAGIPAYGPHNQLRLLPELLARARRTQRFTESPTPAA